MNVNSKMTALANEIRELSGTATTKSIDAMTSDVNAANTEISGQRDLISQITSALEGKAAGGGVTLPTLNNPASANHILYGKEAIDSDGNKITGNIYSRDAGSLAVNGASVITTAGYYPEDVYKEVNKAELAIPSISVDSKGLITSIVQQRTAGYVPATYKQNTQQLTTQAAKIITPTTSSQTAVASGVYTTGAVTVAAIPSSYIQPSGTKSITSNGTHDVKSYASVNVNVAGEDVTAETTAYTTKLASLETAITALETELEGKASGGSGDGSTPAVVTLVPDKYGMSGSVFYYTDAATNTVASTAVEATTININVTVGTLVFIKNFGNYGSYSGSCTELYHNYGQGVYSIAGDCEFTFPS